MTGTNWLISRLIGLISVRWALAYLNHATGDHVSGRWLTNNSYNKDGDQ